MHNVPTARSTALLYASTERQRSRLGSEATSAGSPCDAPLARRANYPGQRLGVDYI